MLSLVLVLASFGCKRSTGDAEVDKYLGIFEAEDREVFKHRKRIVAAMKIRTGMTIADVGAGTGAFMEPFAAAVGASGTVYAVDIAENFVAHIEQRAKSLGLAQVRPVRSTTVSVTLPDASIDKMLVCATYHHFDDPTAMMRSIHRALKPNGEVFIVDFVREPGVTTDEWVLNHVRAGEKTFTKEIVAAGFETIERPKAAFLERNYMIGFRRVGD